MPAFPLPIIQSAQASQAKWGIPAAVTLAQWAVESDWGRRVSGKFNYGGVTARVRDANFPSTPGTPLEPATLCWTHEEVGPPGHKQWVRCQRWFKDYPSADAFFDAHGRLLAMRPQYAAARKKLPDAIAFAHALTGVYASASNYGDTLESLIVGRRLLDYQKGIPWGGPSVSVEGPL